MAPEDVPLGPSAVPDLLDLPFDLASAAAEAMRTGRTDPLPVLVAQHPVAASMPDGPPVPPARWSRPWPPRHDETRGRL